MKRFAKIASLILAVSMMAAMLVFVPTNGHVHAHAEGNNAYSGSKYSLAMDVSSAVQGQFSFVYAYEDIANLWRNPSYPTANSGALTVGDRNLFTVHTDGFIHLDLPATYGTDGYFVGVVFTAPASGVYTFSIEASLYKPAGGWTGSPDKWNNNYVYAAGYVDSEASTDGTSFPVLNQPLVNGVNMAQTPLSITKTVTLKEGEKIAWSPVCGMDGTIDMIKKFDVTLDKPVYDLKMDVSSAVQGQFSFNYASGDIVYAFADNANHPVAENGVLKVGDRELFNVASDGYIHANIPDSAAEYYTAIVFTAPVSGTYTFYMNVGLYKPGSGWNTDGGNWNNQYVYAAGYDVDTDASTNFGALDNWPVRNQTLYNAGNGAGTLEVIVNKTITMNKGEKIAWLPVCGANGAYDLIRAFTVTLEEVNCTSHVWNGDSVCDDCGFTCTAHTWNGDNVCDTCRFTCTAHDYNSEFNCKTCGTPCPHTAKTTGNCVTEITCQACGKTFGKNTAVHTGNIVYSGGNESGHTATYNCGCNTVVTADTAHDWNDGTCGKCDYECQHPTWNAGCCTVCGISCNHTGGTATCVSRKKCTVCGEEYGDVDLSNHAGNIVYSNGNVSGHTATYDCCSTVADNDTAHDWGNDNVCDKCEYECDDHDWNEGTCDICGTDCDHPTWDANGCTVCKITCNHTGGTATCVSRKECTVCGEKYGSLDEDNHEGTTKSYTDEGDTHEAKWDCCQTTDVSDTEHSYVNGVCEDCDHECEHIGNTPDYTVNGDKHSAKYECCDKVAAENENHDFANGDCVCGAKNPAPSTGDNVIAFMIAIVSLCGVVGLAFAVKKRSKRS